MKNLLLTLVTFSVLLLIGCQENSITNPIQDTELQKTGNPLAHTGTIDIEGMLQDPHPVMNSYYIIDGKIQYNHSLKFLNPSLSNPQYLINLNLTVSVNFTYLCTVSEPQSDEVSAGTIFIETNDNFYVSEEGIYLLEKTFSIQGRDDGMVLKCRFLVTTDGIGLNAMWLELNDSSHTNNELS
jgi:hypothetical protein